MVAGKILVGDTAEQLTHRGLRVRIDIENQKGIGERAIVAQHFEQLIPLRTPRIAGVARCTTTTI